MQAEGVGGLIGKQHEAHPPHAAAAGQAANTLPVHPLRNAPTTCHYAYVMLMHQFQLPNRTGSVCSAGRGALSTPSPADGHAVLRLHFCLQTAADCRWTGPPVWPGQGLVLSDVHNYKRRDMLLQEHFGSAAHRFKANHTWPPPSPCLHRSRASLRS